jgi:CubicO group peptidase (beta-lactamase class C family)
MFPAHRFYACCSCDPQRILKGDKHEGPICTCTGFVRCSIDMKKRFPTILAIGLVLIGSPTVLYAQQRPKESGWHAALQRVGAETEAEWSKGHVGSVTIGIVSADRLVFTRSYGYADAEKRMTANEKTIYRIGSITKQFTALMLLQLVEQGKVHLSDPVEKYFPEVNRIQGRFAGAPPITLVQLATHTSGIEREPDSDVYMTGPVVRWQEILISALPHTKYLYEPGTRFSYSNIGYAILGAALSRAAGQPYVEYVQQKIFAPLGMTHSAFEATQQIRPFLAKGYQVDQGAIDSETPEREHEEGRGYKVPNGAIYTTVGDLARFLAFEMGHGPQSVLTNEALNDNFQRIITTDSGPIQEQGLDTWPNEITTL